jgi:DNA (cytosine-5)-methyltransferase 1
MPFKPNFFKKESMKKQYIKAFFLGVSLLYIDLFAGAGGTSTGVETAMVEDTKCAMVIGCVNHDENAIASHAANHPNSLHFTEDIRTLELSPLIEHVKKMRAKYPFAKLVLWASLECTNFSKAKGGLPRDADSRTLAEHLFRYIEALNPDCIQIENVEEFMCWGDLCELGKPISKDKGRLFENWKSHVMNYGYSYDYRILNSADFGAYTSRRRYFAQFAKPSFPIVWPEPTHAKNPSKNTLFDNELKPWNAVKEVLDFSDEGSSIFGRKKPLVEASLDRIFHGLVKFVAGGKDKWMLKYNSVNGKTGKHNPPSIEEPCHTISTQGRLGIINTKFIKSYYGTGKNINSIENPAPTVTTKDRIALVSSNFIDQQFGKSKPSSIDNPLGTITTIPKYGKVEVKSMFYILDSQYSRTGKSIDEPCFTLIARMDKTPPYLIEVAQDGEIPSFIKIDGNTIVYEIYESDSPKTKEIKEFMAIYGIIDIKMRMLKIQELKEIMGFPKDYILVGTQTEQKKYIGNAVEVNTARAICEATVKRLYELRKAA